MSRTTVVLSGLFVGFLALTGGIVTAQGGGGGGVKLRFSVGPKQYTITASGKVTDKRTGAPIADALVRGYVALLRRRAPVSHEENPYQEVRTDATGAYRLTFVTPLTTSGPYEGRDGLAVYTSAPGHESRAAYAKDRVTKDKTDFPDMDFALGPGKLVRGRVTDETGGPVEGALVRVQSGVNGDWDFFGAWGRTRTNVRGELQLRLSTGRRMAKGEKPWLAISKEGYGAAFFVSILDREDLGTVVMRRGGTIAGRVVVDERSGVPNCEVAVRGMPYGPLCRTTTDADGQYQLEGIPGNPTIREFCTRQYGGFTGQRGQATVYARLDPQMNLAWAPYYSIMPEEGATVRGPDLVVGKEERTAKAPYPALGEEEYEEASVSGRLIAGRTPFALQGLVIVLDYNWDETVEADGDGNFCLPSVLPGKHLLRAFLPYNVRGDRDIGSTEIHVDAGRDLDGVQIQLAGLVETRVMFVDANGNPLRGITAEATWRKRDREGGWRQGTESDKQGRALLYLEPGEVKYVRGSEPNAFSLASEKSEKVKPSTGEVEKVRIVMVPTASIRGRVVSEAGEPLAERGMYMWLNYADGLRRIARTKTDSVGRFEMDGLVPGVSELTIGIWPHNFSDRTIGPVEMKPGEVKLVGDIALKRAKSVEEAYAEASERPEVIVQQAKRLLEAIRDADYDDPPHWHDFPGQPYMVQTAYPNWMEWVCRNFQKNPIRSIEVGKVSKGNGRLSYKITFADATIRKGRFFGVETGLFTVPYNLTLEDGTVMQGQLAFEYSANQEHWYGMKGLDWYLLDPPLELPVAAGSGAD